MTYCYVRLYVPIMVNHRMIFLVVVEKILHEGYENDPFFFLVYH